MRLSSHRGLVRVGNADEHSDGAHGQFGAEVLDEVEPVATRQRVQACHAERPDLVFQGTHLLGHERARHQCAVHGVQRRILVDEDPWRHHRIRLDDLEDVALRRAEALRIP